MYNTIQGLYDKIKQCIRTTGENRQIVWNRWGVVRARGYGHHNGPQVFHLRDAGVRSRFYCQAYTREENILNFQYKLSEADAEVCGGLRELPDRPGNTR